MDALLLRRSGRRNVAVRKRGLRSSIQSEGDHQLIAFRFLLFDKLRDKACSSQCLLRNEPERGRWLNAGALSWM